MVPVRSLEDNRVGADGAKALSEALESNSALQTLKYAAAHPFPDCQHPLTPGLSLIGSLDRHPLEIMKLRGTEPVDSIDLSGKGLTVLSGIVIASLISTNSATKSLKYATADATQ